MDKLKINIKTDNGQTKEFTVYSAITNNNLLTISDNCGSLFGITAGDYIQLLKYENDNGEYLIKESYSLPVFETNENSISIILPSEQVYSVIATDSDGVDGTTLTLNSNHGIYPQDFQTMINNIRQAKISSGLTCEYIKNNGDENEYITTGFSLCMNDGTPILEGSTLLAELIGGDKCVLSGFSTNKIYINEVDLESIVSVRIKNNIFFSQSDNNECFFYNLNDKCRVAFRKLIPSRDIPVLISNCDSYSDLLKESIISDMYTSDVERDIIPGYVDMERVRYKPVINGDNITDVRELEFIPHFRERVLKSVDGTNDAWPNMNVIFDDIWYVNSGKTWNSNVADKKDNLYYYANPEKTDYFKADLMGELDFTDDDILYQKSKVKKSFLRISLYSSKNPLNQKLLYYSTVFIDSNKLYNNYVNLCLNEEAIESKERENIPLTRYSADTLTTDEELRCGFIIHNEFDTTRSSDGFYQYLFADDAPLENEEKTIYMKIEFNHAGNGRTIPLIPWINDSGLTIEKYTDMLYIPIKIRYINKEYVYYFGDDRVSIIQDKETGKIKIALFEPLFCSNGS